MYPTPKMPAEAMSAATESMAAPRSASAAATVTRHNAATLRLPRRCATAPVTTPATPVTPMVGTPSSRHEGPRLLHGGAGAEQVATAQTQPGEFLQLRAQPRTKTPGVGLGARA